MAATIGKISAFYPILLLALSFAATGSAQQSTCSDSDIRTKSLQASLFTLIDLRFRELERRELDLRAREASARIERAKVDREAAQAELRESGHSPEEIGAIQGAVERFDRDLHILEDDLARVATDRQRLDVLIAELERNLQTQSGSAKQ